MRDPYLFKMENIDIISSMAVNYNNEHALFLFLKFIPHEAY